MEKFKLKKKNHATKIAAFSLLTMGAIQLTDVPKTNSLFIDDKDTALIYMANLQNIKKNIVIEKVDVGYTYVNVRMNFNRNTIAGINDKDVYKIKTPDACTIEDIKVTTVPDAPNGIDRNNKTITYDSYDEAKQYNHSVELKCLVYTDNEFTKTTDIITPEGNLVIPITVTEQITATKPNGTTVEEEEFTFGEEKYEFKDYLKNYPTPKPGDNNTTIDAITNDAKYKQLILWLNKHIENNIYVGEYYSSDEEEKIIADSWTAKYIGSKYADYDAILNELSKTDKKSIEILPGLIVEQSCDIDNKCVENYFVEEQYYGGLYTFKNLNNSVWRMFFTTNNKKKFNETFIYYLFNYVNPIGNDKEIHKHLILNYFQSISEKGLSIVLDGFDILNNPFNGTVNYNSTTNPPRLILDNIYLVEDSYSLMTPSALNIFYNEAKYMEGAFKEGLELVSSDLKYSDGTIIPTTVIEDILSDENINKALTRNSFEATEKEEFTESFMKYDKENNKYVKVVVKSDLENRKNIVTIEEVDENLFNLLNNNLTDLEKENISLNFIQNKDESVTIKLDYKKELTAYDINAAFIDINKIIKLIDENINDIIKSLSYSVSDDVLNISYKKGEVTRNEDEQDEFGHIEYTFTKVIEAGDEEIEDKPLAPIEDKKELEKDTPAEKNEEPKEVIVEEKEIVETPKDTTTTPKEEKTPTIPEDDANDEEEKVEAIAPSEPTNDTANENSTVKDNEFIPEIEDIKVIDTPRKRTSLNKVEEQ